MALPDLLFAHGDWDQYLSDVYAAFQESFVLPQHLVDNMTVVCPRHPESRGLPQAFWHLISEGDIEAERTPDYRRMERIPWIGWTLANQTDPLVCSWNNRRGRNERRLFLIESERYLIVLDRRRRYYVLRTAYLLRKRRLTNVLKERDEYLKNNSV